jgi:hypothetical protein
MIPTALVTVTLKKVIGLDASLLSAANRPYVLARVAGRMFGRSRVVPAAGGDFDLTSEPMPWTDVVAADGSDIPIVVELWDDRGDAAPAKLGEIAAAVPLPYLSIELTIGSSPGLVIDVHTESVPAAVPAAGVPRVPTGLSTRATLRPVNSLVVEFTDVLGLYAPVATGVAGRTRSERRPGYLSEDHLGRVHLNHDLTHRWRSNNHQIQLEARVTAVRGVVPPDAKVRWKILDVDDPSNDDPGVHRQWGRYLDHHDYDAAGNPKGAAGSDNEGRPSHDPPWEEVPGFAVASKTRTEATTAIVGNQSKVVLHCPSTAGDNFVVAAEVQARSTVESFGARTGVITMWHRIQLESIRMNSGLPLPTEEVPVPFEAACVELEVAPEITVGDRPFMAPREDALDNECTAYVDSVFTHKSDPGWFCIISAMEPHPLPAARGASVFTGRVHLQASGSGSRHFEYFEFPGAHPDVDYATLSFGTESVGFSLWSVQVERRPSGPITRCWVEEHDAEPEFTAGDGSIGHAYAISYSYSPRFRKKGALVTAGGYGMPAEVNAEVFIPGAFYTSGISPTVSRGRKEFFAGRTIIFTHHGAYFDARTRAPQPGFHDDALQVMVHELTHAFGMPHKCGYFDFRTPRAKTCCMNYSPNWMVDDRRNLIPGTDDKVGMDMCGRHLKEVRRVRLQDNRGLAWR